MRPSSAPSETREKPYDRSHGLFGYPPVVRIPCGVEDLHDLFVIKPGQKPRLAHEPLSPAIHNLLQKPVEVLDGPAGIGKDIDRIL